MSDSYKIELGVSLNDKQFNDIKRQINNLTDNTHRVRIDIDNSRLLKQIEHAKKELKGLNSVNGTKGKQPSLDINTKSLEQSLGKVEGTHGITAKNNLLSIISSGKDSEGNKVSKSDRMLAHEELIGLLKETAALNGISLDDFNAKFSKSAADIIDDTTKIQTGVKETEESVERLKSIFGSGIDASALSGQLDSVIGKLNEVKEAIASLSGSISFDNLIGPFDRLSRAIENLLGNAEKVKGILNSGFNNSSIGADSKNIVPDSNELTSSAQQVGKKIGETIEQSVKQTANLDDVIDKQVLDLMDKFSIAGDKGSKAFNEIKQALVECRLELNILKNSDIGIDEEVFDTSRAIDKVSDAIANQHRAVNNLGDEYIKLADYMTRFNDPTKGNKVRLPDFVKQEQGDDYRSNRGSLGIAFNAERGISFADFINDINDVNNGLGVTIDLTKGEEKAFDELLHKVELGRQQRDALNKSNKYLTSTASTEEILEQNGISKEEIYADTMSVVSIVDEAEDKIAKSSREATNVVVQNEERKQQAYRETVKEFLAVQKGSFQRVFSPSDEKSGGINNTAKSVEEYFKNVNGVLADTVSVQERFDADKNLNGFTVSLKNANGAAEQLRYTLRTIKDTGEAFFEYTGGSVNDNGVLKQMNAISAKADSLQNKLDKLKSGYSDTNAARPIKDEGHISELEKQYDRVVAAINDVRNADEATFASMVANAEKEKTALENMIREFRNAENVATSLRSKDIDTVKDTYASKLDVLTSKMKNDGVYTSGFEKGAENLRSVLSNSTDASGLVSFLNGLDKLEAGYKRATAAKKEFNQSQKVGIKVSGLQDSIKNLQRISPEIDSFETEINGAKVSVQSLLNDLKQVRTQGDFSVVKENFRAFKEAAQAAGIAVKETAAKAKTVNQIKFKLEDTGFDGFKQELERVYAEVKRLGQSTPDLEDALRRLDSAMEAINVADEANDMRALVSANEEYEASLKRVNSQLKLIQQTEKNAVAKQKLDDDRVVFQQKIDTWLTKNSAATKRFGAEMRDLQQQAQSCDRVELNHLEKEFKRLDSAADQAGLKMQSFGDKIKDKFKEYMAYFSVAEAFMDVEQALRAMFDTVLEIDTAMTGLYRVTDLTSAQYDTLFDNMISSAKEYGATLNDIINATTDWVRAGFDADTSLGLAEVTTMYQHISDLDYDTAAENLITAYNGFKDELNGAFDGDTVDAVNYIADIFNELDK